MKVDLYSYETGIDLPQPNLNVNPKPNNTKTGVNSNPVEKKSGGCSSSGDTVKVKVDDDSINIRLNINQGLQGPTGEQGKQGLSLYDEAVATGLFTGTYEEFLTKYVPKLIAQNVDPNDIPAVMTWANSNW